MFPSLVFDHHSELETKPPESSGEAGWNCQVCSRQSEQTLGQQTPPPPDEHRGGYEPRQQVHRAEQGGGQGGIQQTKGLGCEPRNHLDEGRASLHPAR